MALNTPSVIEINNVIISQLEANLGQTIPLLPKSFLRVISKVLAGVFILLYKYAGYSFLQTFVRTAQLEVTEVNGVMVSPLLELGRLVDVADPVAATQAELEIDITVEVQTGSLPAGTQLLYSPTGVSYILLSSVLLNAATVSGTVRAAGDQTNGNGAGAIGNLDPGAELTFSNPLANVSRVATVTAQTVTGSDAETEEEYRQRVADRYAKRPQGGAYADYEQWGEEAAGIINVYPYTSTCPGQVDVYVEATPESSGDPDGIPTLAQLQAVLDLIELTEDGLASRRPVGALVNAYPITRIEFDVAVTGLVVSDLAQVQSDIEVAVTQYLASREPFIPGLSIPPRKDRVTRSAIAGAVEDVVSAAGGVFTNVTLELATVNIEIYGLGVGEKAKLGTLSYV